MCSIRRTRRPVTRAWKATSPHAVLPKACGEVHPQLAVRAEDVELADVAGDDRLALLLVELVVGKQAAQVFAIALLDARVAVEMKEQLLGRVEAHGASPFSLRS